MTGRLISNKTGRWSDAVASDAGTALEIHCLSQMAGHAGESGGFGGLSDPAAARASVAHLLKGNHIRFGAADHGRDAFDVDPAIGARSMVDVPTKHPQACGG